MEGRIRHVARSGAAAVCLVLLLTALPSVTHAQGAGSATLRGTILDVTGAPVPGAALTLTSVRTRMVRVLDSSEEGTYVFAALTPDRTAFAWSWRASTPGRAARSSSARATTSTWMPHWRSPDRPRS